MNDIGIGKSSIDEAVSRAVEAIADEALANEGGSFELTAPFNDRTPPGALVEMLVPYLDVLTRNVAARLPSGGVQVPEHVAVRVTAAAWPLVSDERPVSLHALVILGRRICQIERALRALHELERRRLTGGGAIVERISSTVSPNYVRKS